jgi:hypothetical protein
VERNHCALVCSASLASTPLLSGIALDGQALAMCLAVTTFGRNGPSRPPKASVMCRIARVLGCLRVRGRGWRELALGCVYSSRSAFHLTNKDRPWLSHPCVHSFVSWCSRRSHVARVRAAVTATSSADSAGVLTGGDHRSQRRQPELHRAPCPSRNESREAARCCWSGWGRFA